MKILGTLFILIATMLTAPAQAAGEPDPWPQTGHAYMAPPAQESLYRPGCYGFITTDTDHIEPFALDKWVDMRTKIYAHQCKSPTLGNRWVDPVNVEFSFNTEGREESCGFWDDFEGIRYDLYMKDGNGKNYHLPTVTLDCDSSTEGWTIETLRASPNYRVCGTAPRWKTNWTVKINNANDKSGSMGGTLWAFIGPVHDECT